MSQSRAKITVHVQPNARRSEALGFDDGVLRVKIGAPPVKGRANNELIEFLSELLGVGKSSVTIEKGATSRSKVIGVSGLSQDDIVNRLAAAQSPQRQRAKNTL